MMKESILPFWRQEILQEENAAFPPRSAFMLESRNDNMDSDIEAEMDLSETLIPVSNNLGNHWQRRYRSKMVFAAKVFALGIALFAATALVVNIAALIVGVAIGGSQFEDSPISHVLSLDEATTNLITSVDHLAYVFNIDTDDENVSDDFPHDTESQWELQLHISENKSSMHEREQGEATRDLSSAIGSVNTAFDDGEKVLVTKLEEYLCEKIKQVFPGAFEEAIGRICRLVKWDGNAGMMKGTFDRATYSLLGNDRDEHGCIISAGYVWCESLDQCHRPWETKCESSSGDGDLYSVENSVVGIDQDEHGCNLAAGYLWCEASNSCLREWETACGKSDTDDGKTTAGVGVVLASKAV